MLWPHEERSRNIKSHRGVGVVLWGCFKIMVREESLLEVTTRHGLLALQTTMACEQ